MPKNVIMGTYSSTVMPWTSMDEFKVIPKRQWTSLMTYLGLTFKKVKFHMLMKLRRQCMNSRIVKDKQKKQVVLLCLMKW